MKLNGDMIALESRYDVEDLQTMIDCYKAHLSATGSSWICFLCRGELD